MSDFTAEINCSLWCGVNTGCHFTFDCRPDGERVPHRFGRFYHLEEQYFPSRWIDNISTFFQLSMQRKIQAREGLPCECRLWHNTVQSSNTWCVIWSVARGTSNLQMKFEINGTEVVLYYLTEKVSYRITIYMNMGVCVQ